MAVGQRMELLYLLGKMKEEFDKYERKKPKKQEKEQQETEIE